MTGTGFVAYAYFLSGSRMKYVAADYETALLRAQFWYDLFVVHWKGYSVEGEKVVSICVRKPCGTEIEITEGTNDNSRNRTALDSKTSRTIKRA